VTRRSETIPDLSAGLCREIGPDLYFLPTEPTRYEPRYITPRQREQLRATCVQCPVLFECAEWAIANEDHGFWAGMTERQRVRHAERGVALRGLVWLGADPRILDLAGKRKRRAAA
jgi:hypothetical protein